MLLITSRLSHFIAASTKAYSEIAAAFGPGRIFQYDLLMLNNNGSSVVTEDFFATTANILAGLVRVFIRACCVS